jgi:cytochrome c-type biogenesis protein CcmF
MPAGPLLAWKRGDGFAAAQRLAVTAAIVVVVAAISLYAAEGGPFLSVIALFVALFSIAGAMVEFSERVAFFRVPLTQSLARARGLPRSAYGSALAHAGIGIALLGVVAETGWGEERIVSLKPGDRLSIARFDLTFAGLSGRNGPNFREIFGRFEVRRGGVTIAVVEPAKRVYQARNQPTTEAGIETIGLGQLYISIGDHADDLRTSVRIYWKPLVLLIWIGPILMAIGGALSLSDRRLRVGAPGRAKRPVAVPAE